MNAFRKTALTIQKQSPSLLLLPLFGMGIFVLLYVFAALKYPGGSWVEPKQDGFSFWYNYLCDLLDTNAINGELNSARYYARAALAVLCAACFSMVPIASLVGGSNHKSAYYVVDRVIVTSNHILFINR